MSEELKYLIKEEIVDIQYYHQQEINFITNKRFTALAEVSNKESFSRLIEGSLNYNDWVMEIFVGYVKVDPRDQYCKKTGREFAIKYAKKVKFKFDLMVTKVDVILIYLSPLLPEQSNIGHLVFEIKPSRERVYFVRMEIKNY